MKPDITLIFPNSPFLLDSGVFPPLGIMYLSAYLKKHDVKVQCLDMGLGHKKEDAKANIVGISITTPQRQDAFKLADYYDSQGKVVLAGGPHATHMPKECILNGFDRVFEGYAEETLCKYLTKTFTPDDVNLFDGGARIYRSCKFDLDKLPYPDRDALPIKDYKYTIDGTPATVLMTSRGCPYKCSFCAKIDNNFHLHSAEYTLGEIEELNSKYGYEAFMIFDDVFITDKNRLRIISDALRFKKYKFRCFARANLISDEVCKLLYQMGVVEVGIGVESGSNKILKNNLKNTSRYMNTMAVAKLHKYGIRAKAFLIVGLPGENLATIDETHSWVLEARPDDVDISVFQPLPGSSVFANPEKFDVSFKYNGKSNWFKGTPGKYQASVSTRELSPEQILSFRDKLEKIHKNQEFLR